MDITTGMKMTLTDTVTMDNAAKTLGSGSLLVYGTPAMLLLVEKTAVALLEGHLDDGMTTGIFCGSKRCRRRDRQGNPREIYRAGGEIPAEGRWEVLLMFL